MQDIHILLFSFIAARVFSLWKTAVKRLNEATKGNIERFPSDFMFQLTKDEWNILRSQIVTANKNIAKVRFLPYVFTEHGVFMLIEQPRKTKTIGFNTGKA